MTFRGMGFQPMASLLLLFIERFQLPWAEKAAVFCWAVTILPCAVLAEDDRLVHQGISHAKMLANSRDVNCEKKEKG